MSGSCAKEGDAFPARNDSEDFTVGVEEELFVVDELTGALRTDAEEVVHAAETAAHDQIDRELSRSQVETGTAVCHELDDLRTSVTSLRQRLDRAARARGARVMASGTHPWSHWSADGGVTPAAAYLELAETYGRLTDEQVVSGCHVHVCVSDPEVAIAVMNRARLHLPLLIALSANSPFWSGTDTRYCSYRTEVFHRWPTAGIPEPFSSRREYDELVATMEELDVVDAPARLYWDLRPSARYATLEFRAADVMVTVDECVTVAGLLRALVETFHGDVLDGKPCPVPRPEVLRAAVWRAARYGLDDRLLDLETSEIQPAASVVRALLTKVRPVLERHGDLDEVTSGVERLVHDGTGAARQRRAYASRSDVTDVVDHLVAATTP